MSRRAASLMPLVLLACEGGYKGPAVGSDGDTGGPPECAAWAYETSTLHTLPDGEAFARADAEDDCDAGQRAVRLWDLTGDGRLDLVALTDCDDATVGQESWRVWPGEADGFGAEITWALPSGYGAGAFATEVRTESDCTTEDDIPAFFLEDLDGDGTDDLVVTESCADDSLASGIWRVHLNSGAGFGAPEDRPVNAAYSLGSFTAPRRAEACGSGQNLPAWGILDLDGDGPADVALTDICLDDATGTLRWRVMHNDGAAFAESTEWTVPTALAVNAIERDGGGCGAGLADYFLLDVEGDGRPDLVTPDVCASNGSGWYVYPNHGDGFAGGGELRTGPWALGSIIGAPESAEPRCEVGIGAWNMDDADGDGFADITMTASCVDSAIGSTRWALYPGGDDGWTGPVPVALPTGYSAGTFFGTEAEPGCGGSANRPAWVRRDLDGDGRPELVITEECGDAEIGASAWRVYTLTCVEDEP